MRARALARDLAAMLSAAQVEDARFEAELLVRYAAGLERADFFLDPELHERTVQLARALAERRRRREPIPYILGVREFYGRPFLVTPSTLVPRPETELLVEFVLAELGRSEPALVLDVGTGCGCIAVSIACERPAATVVGTDISRDALSVAARNVARFGAPVHLVATDLVSGLRRADIIVANLPYVPREEIEALQDEIREWEPRIALDGGPSGTALIERLVAAAPALRPRVLALEVGAGQAERVAAACEAAGAHASVLPDLGGVPRVVVARWR